MDLLRLESNWWYLVGALALLELAAVVLLVYLSKLRRRNRGMAPGTDVVERLRGFDASWVSQEIVRLCSGEDLDDAAIKRMSGEERALFEVSIIDALNKCSREDQHRLRSALIKYGYDELCARRVMGQDLSDRVRASALLSLLRPQWRHPSIEPERRPRDEGTEVARAARRTTAPLDFD
jgi:hypothetical protein